MARKVLIVGFPGIQALDLVGPFEVFTSASLLLAAAGKEAKEPYQAIAARCGFGTAETMRRNFIRRVGVSPDQYRKTFT